MAMNTEQPPVESSEVQAAIYRVALSLDSFILNGIPYGVIHRDLFNGFLEKTASDLLTELASLEHHAPEAPITSQAKVRELLAALQAKCQQLIDLTTSLNSFRILPVQQLGAKLSQVPLLRAECVQLIQDLEAHFRTPKPFYENRPSHSIAAVNAFLANLERMFEEERGSSKEGAG
jgi:16S rRNA C1402 (ribose-2'-O) methylase RsmI